MEHNDLQVIVAKVDDARLRYEEALMRRLHIREAKERYTNILITYAPDLLKAAEALMKPEESEPDKKPRSRKGVIADGVCQA